MKQTRRVWIVEVKWEPESEWRPTVGIGLSRAEARHELELWKARSRNEFHTEFRLVEYTPIACQCQPCPHDPRTMLGQPIGMYHCPACGEMVLAGFEHPEHDFDCPEYDDSLSGGFI